MATIAIGDIHGNLAALSDLLAQLQSTISTTDTVIFLGDYLDRGPDSKGCIDRILNFRATTPAHVVTLKGNHEDWLLHTMRDYTHHSWLLAMDVFPTIESYSPSAAAELRGAARASRAALYERTVQLPYDLFFDSMPASHIDFLQNLLLSHETADGVFVHAGVDPRVHGLGEQSEFAMLMGAFGFPQLYCGPPVIVYGHHDDAVIGEDGWPLPRLREWTIGIDTISHGVLTACRLPDRAVYQSARFAGSCAAGAGK